MAHHDQLAHHFADDIFATPPARGCGAPNENSNGLLRQYFPKGADPSRSTAEQLRAVEDKLNHRPRKTLGWQTPAQVFIQSPQDCDPSVATTT